MSNELVPYNDLERMGTMLAKSKLFGMKTPEEAIALCLVAQAEGKHPATAAQEYHVIQGRPALKADAMLARFQAAGGKVSWAKYTDKEVCGDFSHPQGGGVRIEWNMDMAKKLGYDSKDNWKKFPRAMMRARCISEGVRTVYPGIAVGIYTPEEVQDFDDKPMVNVTPEAPAKSIFKNASLRNKWFDNVNSSFVAAESKADLKELASLNKAKFDEIEANGNEHDLLAVDELRKRYEAAQARFKTPALESHDEETGEILDPTGEFEMPNFLGQRA